MTDLLHIGKRGRWIKIIIPIMFFYILKIYLGDVFIYKSLFFYFIFIVVTYVTLIYCCVRLILCRKKIEFPQGVIIVSAIINLLLPLLLYLISDNIEFYNAHYYICVFLLFISLSLCVYNDFVDLSTLTNLVIVFAITESILCLLQYFNFVGTNNHFDVTGSNQNPNITSMFLVMCVPLFLKYFHQKNMGHKLLFALFVSLVLISVFLLKSRTGYVGVFIIFLITTIRNYKIYKKRYYVIIGWGMVAVAILVMPIAYNLKRESADGRLFVWKVAIEKVHENPNGYGYGMVQGVFNKAQATVFANRITTESEKNNAEYMSTLNNDYLEILLQGGVIGIIAYLSFFALVFVYCYNTINFFELLGVLSFLVMSCFCFALYSPQVVFVLAIYFSFIKSQKKDIILPSMLNISIVAIGVIMIFVVAGQMYTQIKIRQIAHCIKKNEIETAKIIAHDNFMFTSTSELCNRTLADMYYFEKDFKTASNYYEKAIYYAPFPAVISRLSYCEMKQGYYKKAEKLLIFSANIQPSSFGPYRNLMLFYSQMGYNDKTKKMAYYILRKKPKRISNDVLISKHLANVFLESK